MTAFYRFVRTIAWPLVRLFYWIRTVHMENLPKEGGVILCPNHTSFFDIAFLIITCRRQIYFMAKEELFHNPSVRWLFTNMGAFPVKRGTGGGEAIAHAEQLLQEGKLVCIFPEGTRSKDGKPGKAKSGVAIIAAATGAPVLPMAIFYKGKPHLFRKITLRFGNLIPKEKLRLQDESRAELKRVSGMIMENITALWEEGY